MHGNKKKGAGFLNRKGDRNGGGGCLPRAPHPDRRLLFCEVVLAGQRLFLLAQKWLPGDASEERSSQLFYGLGRWGGEQGPDEEISER